MHAPAPREIAMFRSDTSGPRRAERAEAQARDAAQVVHRRADDVHAGVRVVGPLHRHLVYAKAGALCQDEQLCVEEPGLVLDLWHDLARDLGAQRLEAALCITEAHAERQPQYEHVTARDELAL